MAVRQSLLQEVITFAEQLPGGRQGYAEHLGAVMDILEHCPPELWVTVGQTVMQEGAYRMIAKMETKEEESVKFRVSYTDQLLTTKDITPLSQKV